MLSKYLSVPLLMLVLNVTPSHAKSFDPLSSKQLSELCKDYLAQPNSSLSLQCARYIKGFIDGAIAADTDLANSHIGSKKSISSFKERAIQNRIGNRVTHLTLGDRELGEFCLGEPVTIADVIKTVATEIKADGYQNQSALKAMQGMLKQKYPCEAS